MAQHLNSGCVICGGATITPRSPLCKRHQREWQGYLIDCDASCRPVEPGRWRREISRVDRPSSHRLPAWLRRLTTLGAGEFRRWNVSEEPPLEPENCPDPALALWCDQEVTRRIRTAETWSSVLVYVGGVFMALLLLITVVYAFGPEPSLPLVQVALMGFGAGLLLFYGGIYKELLCHMRYHKPRLTREMVESFQRLQPHHDD